MFNLSEQKHQLLRWCGWFFVGNIILFWLIGLKYLHSISWFGSGYLTRKTEIQLIIFLTVSYLGQLALLGFAPFFVMASAILIYPKRHFIFNLAALLAAVLVVLLVGDTVVYTLFHFHLNGIVLSLVFNSANEQFFDFSLTESLLVTGIMVGALIAEVGFAYFLWGYLQRSRFLQGLGKWCWAVLGVCVYASYTILVCNVAGRHNARFYLETMRILPCYVEVLGAILPMQNGMQQIESAYQRNLVQPAQPYEPLNYPLKKLFFTQLKHKYNVVIIGYDAWRFDMLNPEVTPNTHEFAQQAMVFKNHFSGGNATGPGLFTLFYGLPSSYWTSMQVQKHAPVLLDEFQKQHYQMGIFVSAGVTLPPFNKTIFQRIPNLKLKTAGENPYERDLAITQAFKHFLVARDHNKPFFSFLFYDSSHSYCAIQNDTRPFRPCVKSCDRLILTNQTNPTAYFNRYRNAVHLVDIEFGKVLAELKAQHLLDNTIVIVLGDHGEEFNDNHLGFWGHASNFTRFQTQTPLIVYWPGMPPATYSHLSSHFDIAPTLMEKVLGCKTPADQYSIGHSLFAKKSYSYLIEGSYIGFGVIEKDQITSIFPTGTYIVTQLNGQSPTGLKLHPEVMHKAYLDMKRFYKV